MLDDTFGSKGNTIPLKITSALCRVVPNSAKFMSWVSCRLPLITQQYVERYMCIFSKPFTDTALTFSFANYITCNVTHKYPSYTVSKIV